MRGARPLCRATTGANQARRMGLPPDRRSASPPCARGSGSTGGQRMPDPGAQAERRRRRCSEPNGALSASKRRTAESAPRLAPRHPTAPAPQAAARPGPTPQPPPRSRPRPHAGPPRSPRPARARARTRAHPAAPAPPAPARGLDKGAYAALLPHALVSEPPAPREPPRGAPCAAARAT
jgi:hypothetical protein